MIIVQNGVIEYRVRSFDLSESSMACAIAATISATRKITDKSIRDSILSKIVKQYNRKQKMFSEKEFNIFAKYVLGVPTGFDSKTLIDKFENIQTRSISARAKAKVSAAVSSNNEDREGSHQITWDQVFKLRCRLGKQQRKKILRRNELKTSLTNLDELVSFSWHGSVISRFNLDSFDLFYSVLDLAPWSYGE